jgi:menaquinol-cytochrome c reductase iron-sulfur subunit
MPSQQCVYPDVGETAGSKRRSFLRTALVGLASLVAAGLGIPAIRYISFSPEKRAAPQWIPIGKVNQIGAAPTQITFERTTSDGWKTVREPSSAWVVPSTSGAPIIFAPACTHLGCAYHWDNGRDVFVCPCHGSTFGKDGGVLSGPATRPLDRYPMRIEDGRLLISRIDPA